MAEGLKLPTWELAKEIAAAMPGKGDEKGQEEGESCRECGKPYEEGDEKPGKWWGKR